MISFAHMHATSYAACARQIPGVDLIGITDPNRSRGKEQARQFSTRYFHRVTDFLREGLDAVIVASENARHTEDVLAAAAAGVQVLCEKPIATTLKDARRQIEACQRARVHLMIAFPVRFSPPVLRTKQQLDQGSIGKVLGANTTNHGSMPGGWFVKPRLSGGGAVMDHTVHVVDLLRWFLKDEVAEVYAEAGTLLYPHLACEDCGLLSMRFKRGTIATLDISWSRVQGYPTWGDVTLFLWGERGVIETNALAQRVTVHGARGTQYHEWGSSMDLGLLTEFVTSVRERRPPSITGNDGLRALEVVLAAYRSSRAHQPVTLPLKTR